MHIIGERFHVWKLLIGRDMPLCVATCFPGVVNIDVLIAGLFHPITGHGIGHSADRGVIHAPCKLVPTVPPHRRRFGKAVVGHLMNRRQGEAGGIRAFAERRAVSDHVDELGVGAAPRRQVQLVIHQLAFVFHAALIGSVRHAGGEREAIRPVRALDNLEIKLSDPDGAGDARAFLVKI